MIKIQQNDDEGIDVEENHQDFSPAFKNKLPQLHGSKHKSDKNLIGTLTNQISGVKNKLKVDINQAMLSQSSV